MTQAFWVIVRQSFLGGVWILPVCGLRALLRKKPKWIACCLWGTIGLRLLLPPSSRLPWTNGLFASASLPSLLRDGSGPFAAGTAKPGTSSAALYDLVAGRTLQGDAEKAMAVLSVVWLAGLLLLLAALAASAIRLRKMIKSGRTLEADVKIGDGFDAPFVCGALRPVVCLPAFLLSRAELPYILAHERAHLERRDPLWKTLALLLLCVHWMNPFCWLAFRLFCRDLEYACDERALRGKEKAYVANYAEALLTYTVGRTGNALRRTLFLNKHEAVARVKNLLLKKSRNRAAGLLTTGLCCALLVGGMLLLPSDAPKPASVLPATEMQALRERFPDAFGLDARNGLTVYVCQFAPRTYSCALRSGTGQTPPPDLLFARLVPIEDLQKILTQYPVSPEMLTVIPFTHPASSYLNGLGINTDLIRAMLLADEKPLAYTH